jgi:predicted nucleic acid-binding Zn ribbon protein
LVLIRKIHPRKDGWNWQEGMMVTATAPMQPAAEARQRREQKAAIVMTIVFSIIQLSVILSYDWGAPTPRFRPDAPNIILFGILVATIIYIATRHAGQAKLRSRLCTVCGRGIPFDAVFCPYCGYRFPPP